MGLAVEIGMLADLIEHDEDGAQWLRDALANVNAVLAEHGLPTHSEPEALPPTDDRTLVASFPYSFLHHLRRAYARWKQNPCCVITPCNSDEDPSMDPAVEDESSLFDSHLICHSDCEGFYLPIRFDEILVDETNGNRIPGGILGSSYKLLDELTAMAPCLDISLPSGELSDAEVGRIGKRIELETGLWIESCVWLTLYEAARLSIQHNSAIAFN